MTLCSNIIDIVMQLYQSDPELESVRFINEFPSQKQDLPLRSPIVSVGIDNVEILPESDQQFVAFNASPCTVRLKLCICVPKSQSGYSCYTVLEKILTASSALVGEFTVEKMEADEMKYSSTIAGLVLPFYITLNMGNAYREISAV